MFKKNKVNPMVWVWFGIGRILVGLIFLWAFFDKLFGLGFGTAADKSWLSGGSPTTGFLSSVEGPLADFFHAMAGNMAADVLFMAGLLGIGVALTFGIAVRVGAICGVALLTLMWLASFPLENNPVIDDHVVYAAFLVAVALSVPHQRLSFAKQWQAVPTVKKNPWLW